MKRFTLLMLISVFPFTAFTQNFGNAIAFDGLDDEAVIPHSVTLLPGNSSFSMTCWFQAPDKDQAVPFISKRIPEYPWTQYSYGIGDGDPHQSVPGKKIMVNYIQAAASKERSGRSTYEVINGNWHHLAVIANREVNAIIIYLDGVEIDFHPVYFLGNWPNIDNSYDVIIAKSSSGALLEGKIDELILWNRAIDAHMIHTIMAGPVPPSYYTTNDSGVVAYYRFEEYENLGVGQVGANDIRDIGPFGNHMDTDGGPYLVESVPNASVGENDMPEFEVYPNPSNGKFGVRSSGFGVEDIEILLYDQAGHEVDVLYTGKNRGQYEFDISGLSPGMYFIKIVNGNNMAAQKLLLR